MLVLPPVTGEESAGDPPAWLGARIGPSWPLRLAGAAMLAGILIFSGLIYAETLGAPESIGEIVPTGGTLFMLSWLLVAIGVWRAQGEASLLS